jgi:hypothetical protein
MGRLRFGASDKSAWDAAEYTEPDQRPDPPQRILLGRPQLHRVTIMSGGAALYKLKSAVHAGILTLV